jgi:hypothetical protein
MIRLIRLSQALAEYATEPLTLDELKLYLQLEGTAYDDQLTASIKAVRDQVEQYTNISLTDKTITATYNINGPMELRLPLAPVAEVTDARWRKCPATLLPKDEGYDWWLDDDIFTVDIRGEWKITYSTTALESEGLKEAIKVQAGFAYTNRDEYKAGKWHPIAWALMQANKYGNL